MASTLKANFALKTKYEPFYKGGKVQFTEDGSHVFTQCKDVVHIINIETGKTVHVVANDEDDLVTSFCVTPDSEYVVVASQALLLRQWKWQGEGGEDDKPLLMRKWKAIHTAPISCMTFDVTSTLLATGGADSTIKVWDLDKQHYTHNFKGHQGVISVATFHPDISRLLLFTSAEGDYAVRCWDLSHSVCLAVFPGAHNSRVVALAALGDTVLSAGRDSVVNCWSVPKEAPQSMSKQRTLPVFESVEGLVILPPGQDHSSLGVTDSDVVHFVTAGNKGVLKVWNSQTGNCVFTQKNNQGTNMPELTDLSFNKKTATFNVVTYEQNIIMYKKDSLDVFKQFIGYNDFIMDVEYMGCGEGEDSQETHVAVATNSNIVKVYELATWDCQLLPGHEDSVLCLDVYKQGSLMVTSSKDNSIRLWCMPGNKQVHCVAIGNGHTHHVGAVAFSRQSPSFIVSGSKDSTIKLWPVPEELSLGSTTTLQSRFTEKAHDKDINSIAVSPNDKLIATGSQDKTAKLWNAEDLSFLGTFRGHKRSIWCVTFSPVDQGLATSSADGSIRIWALADFSCVKVFEGHDASVTRVCFVSRGMQLLSTGSDGLLKLWSIKNNECVKTIDAHDDKIWALAVNKAEDTVLTGAEDSVVNAWKDVTEEEMLERFEKQKDILMKEQELSNLLLRKKYVKAIGLAITLDQPFRVLGIIKEILKEETGKDELETTIGKLRDDQIDSILRYVVSWNTNTRHCHVAQAVLQILFRTWTPERLLEIPSLRTSLEGLIPYTARHHQRLKKLWCSAQLVSYTCDTMKPLARSLEDMDVTTVTTSEDVMTIDRTRHDAKDSEIKAPEASKVKASRKREASESEESGIEEEEEEENEPEESEEEIQEPVKKKRITETPQKTPKQKPKVIATKSLRSPKTPQSERSSKTTSKVSQSEKQKLKRRRKSVN